MAEVKQRKRHLLVLRHAPYGSSLARASVDLALAMGAFEQDFDIRLHCLGGNGKAAAAEALAAEGIAARALPGDPMQKICAQLSLLHYAHLTKMGDQYLRSLLVVGMTSLVRQTRSHPERASKWLTSLLERKPARVATVAMANKTARIVWAVLTRDEPYSPRAAV